MGFDLPSMERGSKEMIKEVFVMVLIFIAAMTTLGCLSEKNEVIGTETDHIDKINNVETSLSGRSNGVSNAQTVKQSLMEPVAINYAVLESQGWRVEEFPEFYANFDFMHTTDSIGNVYTSRDDEGAINGIYAVFDNDLEKLSLTVNDITFSNFTSEKSPFGASGYWLRVDIENPIDKKIQVNTYEVMNDKKSVKYCTSGLNLDHSETRRSIGEFYMLDYRKGDPWHGELTSPIIVLNIRFLPTPKRGGEKITQTTDWIPVDEERKIQLPTFAVFMKMEQLRPRGELILTARFDDSAGVTISDAYKNHETIAISFKWDDGSISKGDINVSRRDIFQLMGRDTEIGKTTVKLDSWQATIESTPLLQE